MYYDLVISGFGGQGALFAGQLLAYAAMEAGLQVTWIPSYGPEMRGGTAHCTVIVADTPIGSPLVRNPRIVIALNNPSLVKYEPLVAPGGLLLYNSSLAAYQPQRTDIETVAAPANDLAAEMGDPRVLNMIMLGVLLHFRPIVSLEQLSAALERHLPERHRGLKALDIAALQRGYLLCTMPPYCIDNRLRRGEAAVTVH